MEMEKNENLIQFAQFHDMLDDVDIHIINLLIERLRICKNIAEIKLKMNDKSIHRQTRNERVLIDIARKYPKEYRTYIMNIYKAIIESEEDYQACVMADILNENSN